MRTIPHDGIFRYHGIFNSERIVTTSPKALAEVCTRTYEFVKPRQLKHIGSQILGPGLVLTDGDVHKRQRKIISPSFSSKHIKDLYPTYWNKAKEATRLMTKLFDNDPSGIQEFDIDGWSSRAALDLITLAALGKDFDTLQEPDSDLNKTYRVVFEPTRILQFLAILKYFIHPKIIESIPLSRNTGIEVAAQTIRRICKKVIHDKKERLAKGELKDLDILSVILRGEYMDEDEMITQMMTFLAAGHETVSVGITYAIYMMCLHPEWQTKLRDEVRATVPSISSDKDIVANDIDQLPLLNAFCNEVLRYWPPVPMTTRSAACDTTLLGQHIPKDTRIIVAITGTNRDHNIWGSDADDFKPERWLNAEGKIDASGGASSKYGLLSFMHGPRGCIGQGFARAEMACIVAAWAGRFNFELRDEALMNKDNLKISGGGFSAKPLDGIHVKTRIVEGW